RWSREDYPGGTPRFQMRLFAKDLGIFIGLPLLSVFFFKTCEIAMSGEQKPVSRQLSGASFIEHGEQKSQIIDFTSRNGGLNKPPGPKRAPGSLVKVRLLNVVET